MEAEKSNIHWQAAKGHVYEVHKWAVKCDVQGNPTEFDHARIRPYLCCDAHWTVDSWAGFSRSHGNPPAGFTADKDCVLSDKDANPKFTENGYWDPRHAHAVSTVLIKYLGENLQHGFVDDGPLREDELKKVLNFWSVVRSYHFQEKDPYEQL